MKNSCDECGVFDFSSLRQGLDVFCVCDFGCDEVAGYWTRRLRLRIFLVKKPGGPANFILVKAMI